MKNIASLAAIFLLIFSQTEAADPNYPFPTHNTYFPGVIKPNHVTQEQMDQVVQSLYNEWKEAYVFTRPNHPDQSYISYNQDHTSRPENAVSVSEGHGYGMIITAYMAGWDPQAQAIFDNLFRYYQDFPSIITTPLMGWQQVAIENEIVPNPDGGDDSATDGDLDIAYALLLADKQWGSNKGRKSINYLTHARQVMTGILAGDTNSKVPILKLGDWVENKDPKFGKATRPSDFMLNHLRNFSAYSKDSDWISLLDKAYGIINELYANYSPNTGLMPDFSENVQGSYIPARTSFLERKEDGDYSWNACRTPWRFATDYILSGDTRALEQLTALNDWIQLKTNNKPSKIKAGYELNGEELRDYGSLAFSAPFAVSAMIDANYQSWLNKLWDFTVSQPTSTNYFGDTIRLLCLILVSGNWWTPLNLPPE